MDSTTYPGRTFEQGKKSGPSSGQDQDATVGAEANDADPKNPGRSSCCDRGALLASNHICRAHRVRWEDRRQAVLRTRPALEKKESKAGWVVPLKKVIVSYEKNCYRL
jgi:hypothetical protein